MPTNGETATMRRRGQNAYTLETREVPEVSTKHHNVFTAEGAGT